MDDELGAAEEADRFLRELRLARGRAETTTKAYAEAVVLFLTWCANSRSPRSGHEHHTQVLRRLALAQSRPDVLFAILRVGTFYELRTALVT
ncbi:hypothetical protein AB5J49_44405 [Streptomyces sp. R28]|uniref:Integrase n=1 Tax=Streptomyces sp. R28 TaxID=3238628 RepID=A0AB39QE57_9ACTN